MAKKKSECMKRYGREWSKELTETTREYFSEMFMGPVKHIAGKGSRYAVDRTVLVMKRYAELIPEAEKDKRVFLFTFKDFNPLTGGVTLLHILHFYSSFNFNPLTGGVTGLAFDTAYESVDDMIDDGWAVD